MKKSYLVTAFLISYSITNQLIANQTDRTASQSTEADIVTLSPFEISSASPARYQAAEAAAGGRIAASIMDTPTTVTVLTAEFLSDVGGTRVLEAAKYVAGVGESTIPNGLDRINIRGFQTGGRSVDGFTNSDQANYDHGAIERTEIIKGPDALLSPAGTPGGTINLVTKRPQFTSGGSLTLQVGQYDANRAEVDLTGPLNNALAYRLVTALQDNKGYVNNTFRESFLFSPSLTWRIAAQTNLTLRYEYYDFKASNLEGILTDPSVGTDDAFRPMDGIPRDFNPAPGREHSFRHTNSNKGTFHLTSSITERLSVRLAGRLDEVRSPNSDYRWSPSPAGGSRNPYTGKWEGGVLWVKTSIDPAPPVYVPTPAPQPTNTFPHTGQRIGWRQRARDLQNDWAYIVDSPSAKVTTLLGFAYSYYHSNRQSSTQSLAPIILPGFSGAGTPTAVNPITSDERTHISRYQVYLTESVELFNSRLVLNGGIAHVSFNGSFGSKLSAATSNPPTVAGQMFPGSGSKATVNYGLVVKPLDHLSLYYGHSENAVPANNFRQTSLGQRPLFSEGTQNEFGLKMQFFDERLIASIAYYEIEQTGYAVSNPGNLTNPPPPVRLADLILTREASGYEFQVAGNITSDLSIIASYADTKNRDPNGVMLRGSAEDMGSLFVRYAFSKSRLKGLSIAIGSNYLSKRAVDQATGFTPASTSTNLIPNQPSAYLPARTLVDLYLSYTQAKWSYRLVINNLADKDYIAASTSRNIINVGNPRAVSGSVSYKF